MNDDLMKAILAMDAYNRGYNPTIKFGGLTGNNSADTAGIQIGTAKIFSNSGIYINNGDRLDDNIGFYAIAYDLDGLSGGEKIISYRGTDDKFGTQSGSDITNGWVLGNGNYKATQATMAVQFYKDVAQSMGGTNANLQTVDISLTGHSLGGGLAGYIGALYGQDAYVIDSMDYLTAANNAKFYASLSPSDPQYLTIAKPIIDLVYNGKTPWAVNTGAVTARHIEGEALESPFIRSIPSIAYDLGNNVDLDSEERHSMSTFVIRSFANGSSVNDWKIAAQYFWPVMYDDAFAKQIGMGSVDNQVRQDGEYHDILRQVIAYSALDSGEMPFGNTGIRAMYNDANDLGKALGGAAPSQMLVAHAGNISKAFVQFAGTLALNNVEIEKRLTPNYVGVQALNGILQAGTNTLGIDFSDDTWKAVNKNVMPNMIARADMVAGLYAATGAEASIRNTTLKMWGDSSTNVIDRVVFATTEGGGSYTIPAMAVSNKGTLFVGGTGADIVRGSDSHELIYSGAGNDTVYGGNGNDIILSSAGSDYYYGDGGNDTLDYSADPARVSGGLPGQIIDGYGGTAANDNNKQQWRMAA